MTTEKAIPDRQNVSIDIRFNLPGTPLLFLKDLIAMKGDMRHYVDAHGFFVDKVCTTVIIDENGNINKWGSLGWEFFNYNEYVGNESEIIGFFIDNSVNGPQVKNYTQDGEPYERGFYILEIKGGKIVSLNQKGYHIAPAVPIAEHRKSKLTEERIYREYWAFRGSSYDPVGLFVHKRDHSTKGIKSGKVAICSNDEMCLVESGTGKLYIEKKSGFGRSLFLDIKTLVQREDAIVAGKEHLKRLWDEAEKEWEKTHGNV